MEDPKSGSYEECPECGDDVDDDGICHNCERQEYERDKAAEDRMDSNRLGEGFDKFMDRILIQEGAGRRPPALADSPQRLRQQRRQERPLGRTIFRSGGSR